MIARPKIVIRKQRPEHVRDGEPARWCGACLCGRACMSTEHAEAIAWADRHRCTAGCGAPGGIVMTHASVQRVPDALWGHPEWQNTRSLIGMIR